MDPDVEHSVREACHRRQATFKQVVNEALRTSLRPGKADEPELLPPQAMGRAPGVDPRGLSELADELEVEAYLAAEKRRFYNRKPS